MNVFSDVLSKLNPRSWSWDWFKVDKETKEVDKTIENLVKKLIKGEGDQGVLTVDKGLSSKLESKQWHLISDLHIGSGKTNNFQGKEDAFVNFIEGLDAKKDALIIIGDLLELWQGVNDQTENLKNAFSENKKVFDTIAEFKKRGGPVVYVPGNHDEIMGDQNNWSAYGEIFNSENVVKGPVIVNVNNKNILIMHGHELDPFNDEEHKKTGRAFSRFAGGIERLRGGPFIPGYGKSIESILSYIGEKFSDTWYVLKAIARKIIYLPKDGPKTTARKIYYLFSEVLFSEVGVSLRRHIDKVKKFQQALAKTAGVAINKVFVGHTHHMGYILKEGSTEPWYCNTGTWSGKETRQCIKYTPKDDRIIFYQVANVLTDMEIRVDKRWLYSSTVT